MRYLYLLVVAALVGAISLSAPNAQQSVVVPATTNQVAIAGATGGPTKLATGIAGKQIYVTALALVPVSTAVVTFTTGTGTNCATVNSTPVGVLTFASGQVLNHGTGNGAIIIVPSGDDLCITILTAKAPGYLAFSQF